MVAITVSYETTDCEETVTGEIEVQADVICTDRGWKGSREEPPSPPEFEVRSLTETYNHKELPHSHPYYDILCDKAIDAAHELWHSGDFR